MQAAMFKKGCEEASSMNGPLPKHESEFGVFEARQTDGGEVYCAFREDDEDRHGSNFYVRIRLYRGTQVLRFGEALSLLAADAEDARELRNLLRRVLAGNCYINPYQEFFLECSPVCQKTLNSAIFEFVCINAPEMHKKEVIVEAEALADKFPEHLGTGKCVQFMSPAPAEIATNLLAPSRAPGTALCVYRSIASFCRDAQEEQVHDMLQLLGSQSLRRMRERGDPTLPLWISTAGYDLPWLRIRLDNKPIILRFKEYKTHSRGGGLKSLSEGGVQACVVQVGRTSHDFKKDDEESCATVPFIRVRFCKGGIPLMFGEVVQMWAGDTTASKFLDPEDTQAFRTLCAKVFAGCFWEGKEVFLECRPVTYASLMTTVFEFVAIMAPDMHKKPTDGKAFEDKFENHMGTMDCLHFMTPSLAPQETELLAPSRSPDIDLSVYRSARSFFGGAPKEQVNNMFELLGRQIPERMTTRADPNLPLYVSTAGYSLAWVHLRLDNEPKYYRFKDYKTNVDFYR